MQKESENFGNYRKIKIVNSPFAETYLGTKAWGTRDHAHPMFLENLKQMHAREYLRRKKPKAIEIPAFPAGISSKCNSQKHECGQDSDSAWGHQIFGESFICRVLTCWGEEMARIQSCLPSGRPMKQSLGLGKMECFPWVLDQNMMGIPKMNWRRQLNGQKYRFCAGCVLHNVLLSVTAPRENICPRKASA